MKKIGIVAGGIAVAFVAYTIMNAGPNKSQIEQALTQGNHTIAHHLSAVSASGLSCAKSSGLAKFAHGSGHVCKMTLSKPRWKKPFTTRTIEIMGMGMDGRVLNSLNQNGGSFMKALFRKNDGGQWVLRRTMSDVQFK